MRVAEVYVNNTLAGLLTENDLMQYIFEYVPNYHGTPISYTMPVSQNKFQFETFPPFFDGFLPEGNNLETMLMKLKIDKNDYFAQLLAIGKNMVGDIMII